MINISNGSHEPLPFSQGVAEAPIFAALDLGTNNCRLLVATPKDGGGLRIFDSFSRVVRLGEGVSTTEMLSDDAMDRTMAALQACRKKLDRYNITDARFVATEACRRAGNGLDFLARVKNEMGMEIDIITTEDEATLAFTGCSALLTGEAKHAVVFDIGGGSTELMLVDIEAKKTITDWLSVGFGVMNLSDRFGGPELADIAFSDMVSILTEKLKPFEMANNISKIMENNTVQLLSTSGTVTTLAAIHLGLPRYDRTKIDGITLSVVDIKNAVQKLLAMRPSERFNNPCIGADRADFILSGCAIFEAISNLWPTQKITIADRGVREGIILSLLEKHRA